jgi:dihydroneopterin aldolase
MSAGRDKIRLKDIQIYAYHGALEEERRLGQLFELDCEVTGDFGRGGSGDDLYWTVDYTLLYQELQRAFLAKSYQLLETCGAELATAVLAKFRSVDEVVIRVRKPHVPMGGVIGGVEVEIARKRIHD